MRIRATSVLRDRTIAMPASWCWIGVLACSSYLFCSLALADKAPVAAEHAALPRYRLEVGQELVYELTKNEDLRKEDHAAQDDAPRDQMHWRVFVVRKNDDGSWRLYIRSKIAFFNPDGRVRARRNSLGYCDLHPDGSYALDESTAILKRLIPDEIFCGLPATEAELDQGWRFRSPVTGYEYQCRLEDRQNSVLQFAAVQSSAYEQMHAWHTSKQYAFDTQQGLVNRITGSYQRGGQLVERKTFELTSMTRRDPAWVDRFRRESHAYTDAYGKWAALCRQAYRSHSVEACRTVRDAARDVLTAGREQAELDVIRNSYDDDIQSHEADKKWALASVEQRQEFLDAASHISGTWEAKNLDGGTFRLADQRGKVVVLDFWGTNCEYCVLMAPQVKQLVNEYRGKEVVFLGVFDRRESDDAEDARAKSLIDSVYQGLSHVEGHDVAELYRLRQFEFGYPLLVILDQSGAAHEVHHGYDADMPKHVRTILDDLLSKPARAR